MVKDGDLATPRILSMIASGFLDLHSKIFSKWVFPKILVPHNGWFTMEKPIKMDDLGGFNPLFLVQHPNGC